MQTFNFRSLILLTLGAMACGDKETEEVVDTGTTVSDSDTDDTEETEETGSDTDTESETGVDTDTGEDAPTGPQATFQLRDASGMKIGLVQVDLVGGDDSIDTAEPQDDGPRFLDTQVVSPELDGEISFSHSLETPDESVLFELDPDVPARLGMWAPFLFDDANGDGQYNDGETIGGFSNSWLVYSTEAIPVYNVGEGWGVLIMTFSEDIPMAGDLANISLEGTMRVTESLTLGGSYDTSIGSNRRIAFVAAETMDSTIEMMAEVPATDPWTVTFSGTPPAHFFSEDSEFAPATSLALVYEDTNGDGQFDMAEAWSAGVFSVCANNTTGGHSQIVTVIYTPEITDLSAAMGASMYGLNPGWAAMKIESETPIFLSETERNNLVIDANCVLE